MRTNHRRPCVSIPFLPVLGAALLAGAAPQATAAQEGLTMQTDASTVTVRAGERPVLEYRFAEVPFKPYVKALLTPEGVNVLRDAPHDHLHHHALMFAVGLAGVDFWSEAPTCGKQVHVAFDRREAAGGKAVLAERLDWVGPDAKEPVAREVREVTAFDEPGVSLLVWRTRLEAGPGRAAVPVTGSHYFGLGLRPAAGMDQAAEFLPADPAAPRDNVRGDENVFPSAWLAVTGAADGKPVTVAMFDHPANPRPVRWFTMAKPFAYMSATLNLYKEPMTLEAGRPLALTYGVAAWDGKKSADEVRKVYERWLALVGAVGAGGKVP